MDDVLFSTHDLREFLESLKDEIKNSIDSQDNDYILKVSESDYSNYLFSEYQIEPITLKKELASQENPKDIDIDVSKDQSRIIFDREHPFYVKGTEISVIIPFDGNPKFFFYRASTYSSFKPRGNIRGNELIINISILDQTSDYLSEEYDRRIGIIEKHLEWTNGDIKRFNNELLSFIIDRIKKKKEKILRDRQLVASLKIPLKRIIGNLTYEPPEIKRKITFKFPEVSKEKFEPEPCLSEEEYNHILKIIQSMVKTMERSPSTFSKFNEEELRDIILVQLNGHYEGMATGETFNASGKTDILIRIKDKNVFIAECKFWHGEKEFHSAIDQLLDYLCWRDTKTAIIIFNKNKEFSKVIEKIEDSIKKHSSFKRFLGKLEESIIKYLFSQKNDKNRELYLTILAFDIPRE
jgi:hypothetical protein